MTTFRELEAFAAVADMGSFEKAAKSLDTSQSSISRQISDFESSFSHALFNREQRAARLTMEGQEVLRLVRAILRQRSNLTERFGNPDLVSSTLRLGVTELAALTWLGRYLARLRERYPLMRVELEVGSSASLHSSIRSGQLDLAILLDAVRTVDMARLPIGTAEFGWYCASSMSLPSTLTLTEFERQTVLLQGEIQTGGSVLSSWLVERGIRISNTIHSDSLVALAGICAAGVGLAGLPKAVASGPVRNGALREIEIPIGAPAMNYIALVRIDAISEFHRIVAALAEQNCDFGTPFDGY